MNNDPKVFLVLDNCFAMKRWITPKEWAKVISEIGFKYIEASFDNEIDMLFTPTTYKKNWFKELEESELKYDVKVVNFYTGYQTYRTAGLAHDNVDYADYIVKKWFYPAIDYLADRGNGLGFSYHALTHNDLSSRNLFDAKEELVEERLVTLANYIGDRKIALNIEQMYAPHQTPWTIEQSKKYLKYHEKLNISIDVGHMLGQNKWHFPKKTEIMNELDTRKYAKDIASFIVAPPLVDWWDNLVDSNMNSTMDGIKEVFAKFNEYSYYYSLTSRDSDPYAWLEELGAYSPIIHLQQTDGITGGHKPFTAKNNQTGIIKPLEVLEALKVSFDNLDGEYKAKPAENIYLTFEIFASNTDNPSETISDLKETLAYWRKIIPKDGMYLSEILKERG